MPSRRESILDAAAAVMAERGYERATIRQVARQAGVSDGTIYNYFADKRALLTGLIDRLGERERQRVDLGIAPSDFEEVLRAFARHRTATLWSCLELLRATWPELLVDPAPRADYFESVLRPTLRAGETLLTASAASGNVRCADPALTSRLVTASLLGLALLRLFGDTELDARVEDVPDGLVECLVNGLARPRD